MSDTRSFIFGFGTASNLSGRQFDIYKISDVAGTNIHSVGYSGSAEVSNAVTIGPGRYRAVLVDSRTGGGTSRRLTGVFDSTEMWPKTLDDTLKILSAEDMSSSSSLSSSSSS